MREHLNRMQRAAEQCQLDVPYHSEHELLTACNTFAESDEGDLVLRLTIFREGAGLYLPEKGWNSALHYLVRRMDPHNDGIFPESSDTIGQVLKSVRHQSGIGTGILSSFAKSITPMGAFKSTSADIYRQALEYGFECNWDEVILLNQNGRVCECSSSNLLVELKGELFTPPLSDGPVDGTLIRWLKRHNLVQERSFQPRQLYYAEALYRCNSVRGIQPLVLI